MYLTLKDLKKYFIFVLFFFWILIFSHLFYLYIQEKWKIKPIRWWTIIEGVINKPLTFLPYIGNNYHSKYLQSLLYKTCINWLWENEICSINTNDDKKFVVKLTWDNYWSDGRKITLDDIYFTYENIIRKNSLNLSKQIPNDVKNIEKKEDSLIVQFNNESVNNKEFFKSYILPKHILNWRDKDFYKDFFTKNFINSTCVKLSYKSDFKKNIILNYKDCDDYYINFYQFLLLDDVWKLSQYITWDVNVDLYNSYENIKQEMFQKVSIKNNLRYAFFFNIFRQENSSVKAYLAKNILTWLKEDINISEKMFFNWYGLFNLPQVDLKKEDLAKQLKKENIEKQKNEYKNSLMILTWESLNYSLSWKNEFFIENKIKNQFFINWDIWTWKYDRLSISQNWTKEYFPSSYDWEKFKYILSEDFENVNKWRNYYTLFWYNWSGNKQKLDNIVLFYKNIEYPEFKEKIKPFVILYLNDNWFMTKLWDVIADILKKSYPWKVVVNKVYKKEYWEILKSWNYDLVISSINFDWKDISFLFKTKNPLSNPSLFVNKNFSSLISQNLLVSMDLKNKIFSKLNKIYKKFIPIVFIWNKKMNFYFNKKYYLDNNLDYSFFENRKKFIKDIIINKIKKPKWESISFYDFIDFLKKNASKNQ